MFNNEEKINNSLIKAIFLEKEINICSNLDKIYEKSQQQLKKRMENIMAFAKLANTIVGDCPHCKFGKQILRLNRGKGTYFLGCSCYPSCNYTHKLPKELGGE